jgi:hypothetical protein
MHYGGAVSEDSDRIDDAEASEFDIDTIFKQKLSGLPLLPKKERAAARRAARDWRRQALMALREKRATARHARYMLRQSPRLSLG